MNISLSFTLPSHLYEIFRPIFQSALTRSKTIFSLYWHPQQKVLPRQEYSDMGCLKLIQVNGKKPQQRGAYAVNHHPPMHLRVSSIYFLESYSYLACFTKMSQKMSDCQAIFYVYSKKFS